MTGSTGVLAGSTGVFCVISLEGVRNFAPEVSPEISGAPEVPSLYPRSSSGSTGVIAVGGKFVWGGSTAIWAGTIGPAGI